MSGSFGMPSFCPPFRYALVNINRQTDTTPLQTPPTVDPSPLTSFIPSANIVPTKIQCKHKYPVVAFALPGAYLRPRSFYQRNPFGYERDSWNSSVVSRTNIISCRATDKCIVGQRQALTGIPFPGTRKNTTSGLCAFTRQRHSYHP
jgi:hypothetical protein